MLNGKEVPYYEAIQKQRAIENNIRKTKRSIQTLDRTNQDSTIQRTMLTKLNKQLTNLCNEIGLEKDHSRMSIANYASTNKKKNGTIIPEFNRKILNKQYREYSENQIKEISNEMNKVANKYTTNKTKWSGKTYIDEIENSGKMWDCSIVTPKKTSPFEILHEHIHAHSVSYSDIDTYLDNANIEEGIENLITQEISKKENIKQYESEYDYLCDALRNINDKLKIEDDYIKFANTIIKLPIEKRVEFLNNKLIEDETLQWNEKFEIAKSIELLKGSSVINGQD